MMLELQRTGLIFDSLLAMAIWGVNQYCFLRFFFFFHKNNLDLSSACEIRFHPIVQSFHFLLETSKAPSCKIGRDEL